MPQPTWPVSSVPPSTMDMDDIDAEFAQLAQDMIPYNGRRSELAKEMKVRVDEGDLLTKLNHFFSSPGQKKAVYNILKKDLGL